MDFREFKNNADKVFKTPNLDYSEIMLRLWEFIKPELKSLPVEAEVMRKRFLNAYKQPQDENIIAIRYLDEKQRRCTMFIECGNKLAGETLIELIKLSA